MSTVPESALHYPVEAWSWDPADVRLYNLSIGAPHSALDDVDLTLVTGGAPAVFPTMAVLLADGHSLRSFPLPGVDYDPLDVIYAGHRLEILGPLNAQEAGTTSSQLLEVRNTSAGVLVVRESLSRNEAGRPLVRNVVSSIIRGARTGSVITNAAPLENALASPGGTAGAQEADFELRVKTLLQQAVLYSQNGDVNPLHISPAAAKAAGFARPILHGLCSYGMIAHALLGEIGGQRWGSMGSISARFTAPVVPGDILTIRGSRVDDRIRFSAWAGSGEEERLVVGRGLLTLAG